MEILFFIILTAVISSFIEYYRDKNKYFRAREEGSIKKVKDFLSGNKHRDLADALEKIKEDIYEDRNTEIRVPREEYLEYIKGEKFKELKMERLKLDEYKCQICFKKVDEKTSHCHHITYLRVLNEKISDLSTLCPCCHKKLHEFHGKNKGHYPLISIEKLY
jgi:hypothetical protein